MPSTAILIEDLARGSGGVVSTVRSVVFDSPERAMSKEIGMNKKSALLTASGLAASFVAGAAAVSYSWGVPSVATVAAGGSGVAAAPLNPIVKHRTVVIHKRSPAPARSRTVVLPASARSGPAVVMTGGSPTTGMSDDEGYGEEDGDD